MKDQRKRLQICVALVLLCTFVLPLFGGCAKDAPTTTTAEEVMNQETQKGPDVTKAPPVVTKSDPNAPSLESTPNKGGNKKVTSASQTAKSAWSAAQELVGSSSSVDPNTIAEKRDLAESYMRALLSVKWKVAEDVTYGTSSTANLTFVKDRVYQGVPYTNGGGALETWLLYSAGADKDGVHTMNIKQDHIHNGSGTARLGLDHCDALFVAWHTVSSSSYGNAIGDFVPVNGFVPVGDYEIPELTEEQRKAAALKAPSDQIGNIGQGVADKLNVLYDNSISGDTDEICKHNGDQKMYAAYSKLQKADGLIRSASNAACMMVVSVDVKYNADGTIDGDASTITVLQQANDKFTQKVEENGVYPIGYVDRVVTFKFLYDQFFVPMTVKELAGIPTEDLDPTEFRDGIHVSSQNKANMYVGFITFNRRALWSQMIVTDENGVKVADTISPCSQADNQAGTVRRYSCGLAKIDDAADKKVCIGDEPVATSTLETGKTYRCVVKVTLISGHELTVRDFTFVA